MNQERLMKISVLNQEISNFYDAFYKQASYFETKPEPQKYPRYPNYPHGNEPQLGSYPDYKEGMFGAGRRYADYCTRMAAWAMVRGFYKVVKEPFPVNYLRNFYNSLPNRESDRDFTREELFSLFDNFLLAKTPQVTQPGFEFAELRKQLQETFQNSEMFDTVFILKEENRFKFENFNELINRDIADAKAAADSTSTAAVANALSMPLSRTSIPQPSVVSLEVKTEQAQSTLEPNFNPGPPRALHTYRKY
jgi:hypothetical protein